MSYYRVYLRSRVAVPLFPTSSNSCKCATTTLNTKLFLNSRKIIGLRKASFSSFFRRSSSSSSSSSSISSSSTIKRATRSLLSRLSRRWHTVCNKKPNRPVRSVDRRKQGRRAGPGARWKSEYRYNAPRKASKELKKMWAPKTDSWERAWINLGRGQGVRKWMMHKYYIRIFGYDIHLSMSEVFGHMSFGLLAISYAVSDMLGLRVFAIASIGSMMVFNFWHPVGFTLWLPFRWNCMFLLLNLAWVGHLVRQTRMDWIDPTVDLDSIRRQTFPSLQMVDFARLMKCAELQNYPKDFPLTTEGDSMNRVHLVIRGSVEVSKKTVPLYDVSEGQFVGTLGLHTSLYIDKAIVTAKVTSRNIQCLDWDRESLLKLVESNPRIQAAVDAAISIDELRKTFAATTTLAEAKRNGSLDTEKTAIYQDLVSCIASRSPKMSESTKTALKRFRTVYGIHEEEHEQALHKSDQSRKQH